MSTTQHGPHKGGRAVGTATIPNNSDNVTAAAPQILVGYVSRAALAAQVLAQLDTRPSSTWQAVTR